MLKYIPLILLSLSFSLFGNFANASTKTLNNPSQEKSMTNASYVYKIMTLTDWEESQKLGYIKPSTLDLKSNFIHLSEKEQVEGTINKFMKGEANIIVLTLEPTKFEGRLIKEKNPGGTTEYFHLYDGKIPLSAVVESNPHQLN